MKKTQTYLTQEIRGTDQLQNETDVLNYFLLTCEKTDSLSTGIIKERSHLIVLYCDIEDKIHFLLSRDKENASLGLERVSVQRV